VAFCGELVPQASVDLLWNIILRQFAQMPVKQPEHSKGPRTYPGDKARQGDIVLRKP